MKIFLLGLPGSGKSTLGKGLAEELALPFVDLDKEIEKAEGMLIKDIFDKKKEDYFRRSESEQLRKWCGSNKSFVMATGGGVPVFFDNMNVINASGKSIFLDVAASTITKRIMNVPLSERPMFAKTHPESLKDHIEFMRSHRIPFYRQAHHIVSGDDITVSDLVTVLKKETQP